MLTADVMPWLTSWGEKHLVFEDDYSSGNATLAISSPSVGTYSYSASYAGDSSFNAGTSTIKQVAVGKASVVVTVSTSFNQAILGSPVTVIAKLASLSATGTVQFYDNGTALGSPVSVSRGAAQLTTSSLTLGAHAITAAYSGDTSFNSGTSAPLSLQVVSKGTVALSFTGQFDASSGYAPGVSLTFLVHANPAASGPSPTGTFSILDGSTPVSAASNFAISSTVVLNTPTMPLTIGTHNLTLTYSGDAYWLAAGSSIVTVTIADFTLAAATQSVSVAKGGVIGIPVSFSNSGLSGNLSLSCSGLPAETSYSFSPASPTVATGAYLTITTTAPHTASLRNGQRPRPGSWRVSTVLMLGSVLLLAGARVKHRYWHVVLSLLLATLLIAGLGCGGGGGGGRGTTDQGTPAGTYTITVTATSGTLTHNTQFGLTVY